VLAKDKPADTVLTVRHGKDKHDYRFGKIEALRNYEGHLTEKGFQSLAEMAIEDYMAKEKAASASQKPEAAKSFREKAAELQAMARRGEITTQQLGERLMQIPDDPVSEQADKSSGKELKLLMDKYENGEIELGDIIDHLEGSGKDKEIQEAIKRYREAQHADRYEYGMRSGLDIEQEERIYELLRKKASTIK